MTLSPDSPSDQTPPMTAPETAETARPPTHLRRTPVLCASAASRLLWAAGALMLLWLTTLWALS